MNKTSEMIEWEVPRFGLLFYFYSIDLKLTVYQIVLNQPQPVSIFHSSVYSWTCAEFMMPMAASTSVI